MRWNVRGLVAYSKNFLFFSTRLSLLSCEDAIFAARILIFSLNDDTESEKIQMNCPFSSKEGKNSRLLYIIRQNFREVSGKPNMCPRKGLIGDLCVSYGACFIFQKVEEPMRVVVQLDGL